MSFDCTIKIGQNLFENSVYFVSNFRNTFNISKWLRLLRHTVYAIEKYTSWVRKLKNLFQPFLDSLHLLKNIILILITISKLAYKRI